MARPNWNYIRVDNQLPDDDKLLGLSPVSRERLIGCLVMAWAACDRHRTDGWLSADRWRQMGTTFSRRLALERGFAAEVDGGVQMHNYLGYQRSRAEIEELSENRRKAGSLGGRAKANRLASARGVATEQPFSKRSKPLAEAEAEAEAEAASPQRAGSASGTAGVNGSLEGTTGPPAPPLRGGQASRARNDSRTAELPEGTCPVCGTTVTVQNGRIFTHLDPDTELRCDGTGAPAGWTEEP